MIDQNLLGKFKSRNWRIDNLYKILTVKNDRETGQEKRSEVVFKRNGVQRYLDSITHPRKLIPKARQLGVTTYAAIDTLDKATWRKNYAAAIIANNQKLAATLFDQKIKFPFDNPAKPDLMDFRSVFPLNSITSSQMVFQHNSEVSVRTAATGLALNKLHVSELGRLDLDFPDRARELVNTSFPALPPGAEITIESTADAGPRGEFYRLCSEAAEMQQNGIPPGPEDFVMIFFAWFLDPNYRLYDPLRPIPEELRDYFNKLETQYGVFLDDEQKQFYAAKHRSLRGSIYRQFPSTWEECFMMSQEGIVYSDEIEAMDFTGRLDTVPYRRELPVDTWWDLGTGENDQTSIWFTQTYPTGVISVIDYYENVMKGMKHYADHMRAKPYSYGYHVAPWDIVRKSDGADGRLISKWTVANNLGIRFQVGKRTTLITGIESTRNLFPRLIFDRERCNLLVTRLRNYRYEYDEDNKIYTRKPVHDINSHAADAGRTLSVNHEFIQAKRLKSNKPKNNTRDNIMGALT